MTTTRSRRYARQAVGGEPLDHRAGDSEHHFRVQCQSVRGSESTLDNPAVVVPFSPESGCLHTPSPFHGESGAGIPDWARQPQSFRRRTTGRRGVAPLSCCILRSACRQLTSACTSENLITTAKASRGTPKMQQWTPPESAVVFTDLLWSHPPQQQVYVKLEPVTVSSRRGILELPPLLPPRVQMLPAITDVLRATSPQHQRYGYENQVNTGTRSLPRTATPPKSSYAETISQYPTDNFATYICCPNTTDYNRLMPPNVPPTSRQLPTTSGNTTPPGLLDRPTELAGLPGAPITWSTKDSVFDMGVGSVAQLKVARVEPNILVVVGSTSRGYCWSHGGGTKCKTEACDKIAISNGMCWAHGGGCRKQAYERTCNYCNGHFQQYQQTALQLARHQPPLKRAV
ncbi:hypothetical protein GN244_ATG01705 [Phytophthora infestans]|uniref:WRKY19-like zinc finger domain-containing protein n=1 Tax=Phytophthora infestans TaxID=4787 RepID=A0A833WM85_PHYIN|nr:hypothetical protein GN244_ATG01705 [Phytophthora infestans]